MKLVDRNRPRRSPGRVTRLAFVALAAGGILFVPNSATAQQQKASSSAGPSKLSAADSAACVQVITYAMQHPDVLQKSEELKASSTTKAMAALPDTLRARVSSAIAKGQGDTLKAIARRTVDSASAPKLDAFIDFVVAFPDSVRRAVATLVASNKSMTCS